MSDLNLTLTTAYPTKLYPEILQISHIKNHSVAKAHHLKQTIFASGAGLFLKKGEKQEKERPIQTWSWVRIRAILEQKRIREKLIGAVVCVFM